MRRRETLRGSGFMVAVALVFFGACGDKRGGGGDGGPPPGGSGGGGGGGGGAGGNGGGGGASPGGAATCPPASVPRLPNARLPAGFCAWIWASGVSTPRGIEAAPNGDLLVVERGGGRISALFDMNGDGTVAMNERAVLASASGLNHGIALNGGFLYASSATTVYRWPYQPGQRTSLGMAQTVITLIPSGGHSTRTPAFDREGRLYVSVGSAGNLDPDSSRARIRRFSVANLPAGGMPFSSGEVFADGLRNEVGLAFDSQNRLWGVENGSDNLSRGDLGGDIHEDNPAEEMNLFAEAGKFYGYPYCWSELALPAGRGRGAGSQWAYPQAMGDGTHTDAWCQNPANNVPPRFSMPAHTAPLDIMFYSGAAFPAAWRGDALVALHGSWNRNMEAGYKVIRVAFANGNPARIEPLLEFQGPGDRSGNAWPHRPVGVRQGKNGEVYVSSDASNAIIAIGYAP